MSGRYNSYCRLRHTNRFSSKRLRCQGLRLDHFFEMLRALHLLWILIFRMLLLSLRLLSVSLMLIGLLPLWLVLIELLMGVSSVVNNFGLCMYYVASSTFYLVVLVSWTLNSLVKLRVLIILLFQLVFTLLSLLCTLITLLLLSLLVEIPV